MKKSESPSVTAAELRVLEELWRRDEPHWLFSPLVARDELIGGELRRVADRQGHWLCKSPTAMSD